MQRTKTGIIIITEQPALYDVHEEPIVVSKALLDLLLKQKRPADLIALYTFYYYTAKWQKTNVIKATDTYVQNGLAFGKDKFIKAKQKLIELGLIEKVQRRNDKKQIIGWYIKVNFIWSKKNLEVGKPDSRVPDLEVGKATCRFSATNTLNTNNKNTLSTNRKKNYNKKNILNPSDFSTFWELYPKKVDKGKTETKFIQICSRKDTPGIKVLKKAIKKQKKTKRWQNKRTIPNPTTWLNQRRWLDDPAAMNETYDFIEKDTSLPRSGYRNESKTNYEENEIIER